MGEEEWFCNGSYGERAVGEVRFDGLSFQLSSPAQKLETKSTRDLYDKCLRSCFGFYFTPTLITLTYHLNPKD